VLYRYSDGECLADGEHRRSDCVNVSQTKAKNTKSGFWLSTFGTRDGFLAFELREVIAGRSEL
jgi:hypothetical protein